MKIVAQLEENMDLKKKTFSKKKSIFFPWGTSHKEFEKVSYQGYIFV